MATSERIYGTTPNGGDYSELFYVDKNDNLVEPEQAFGMIIRECKSDGTIISTTRAIC